MNDETHEKPQGEHAPAHEEGQGRPPTAPYGEHLTPEQHEQLAPLLELAAVGNPALKRQLDKMTPGQEKRQKLKRQAIDALREHGTIIHAAAAAGVAPSTIYRWREADPVFAAEVDEFLNVTYLEELERSMFSIATSADPKMANAAVRAGEFLMKAEDPDKYGDKLRTENTQTINHMVQVVHTVRDDMRARQVEARQRLQQMTKTIDAEANMEKVKSDMNQPAPALPSTETSV